MKFDIKCTSKEDGEETTYSTALDKNLIITRVHEHTGVSKGELIRMLNEGIPVQTSFFYYERA